MKLIVVSGVHFLKSIFFFKHCNLFIPKIIYSLSNLNSLIGFEYIV